LDRPTHLFQEVGVGQTRPNFPKDLRVAAGAGWLKCQVLGINTLALEL